MIQPGCCTGPRCSCPLWPLSHARRRLLLLFSLLSWVFCSSAAGVFCFLPLFPFILQEFCSAWGKGWGWRGLRARRKSRERRRWGCCQAYSDPLVPPWSPLGPPLLRPTLPTTHGLGSGSPAWWASWGGSGGGCTTQVVSRAIPCLGKQQEKRARRGREAGRRAHACGAGAAPSASCTAGSGVLSSCFPEGAAGKGGRGLPRVPSGEPGGTPQPHNFWGPLGRCPARVF